MTPSAVHLRRRLIAGPRSRASSLHPCGPAGRVRRAYPRDRQSDGRQSWRCLRGDRRRTWTPSEAAQATAIAPLIAELTRYEVLAGFAGGVRSEVIDLLCGLPPTIGTRAVEGLDDGLGVFTDPGGLSVSVVVPAAGCESDRKDRGKGHDRPDAHAGTPSAARPPGEVSSTARSSS